MKQAAARRRRTIGELVCESLTEYGTKSERQAHEVLEAARQRAGMEPEEAGALAVAETKAHRG